MTHQTEDGQEDLQIKQYDKKLSKELEYTEKMLNATTLEEKKFFAKKVLKFGTEASELAKQILAEE